MMIRALTVSMMFAVLATPANAQDSGQPNPDTRQTDQSEDDWRKSRKKRDSGDIFKDIVTNPNDTGSGGIWGGEVKAIDRLNPESRRHLNRLRAKALAEAGPGEPIDATFEPSDAAKSDEYIARQEEKAWEDMVKEANSGLGGVSQPPSQEQGTGGVGDQADPAQTGTGQGGTAGDQGQIGQSGGGQSPSTNSPLRGGSAASASDILNQIKGRGSASGSASGQGEGETQNGQSPTAEQIQQSGTSGDEGSEQAEGQAQADAASHQSEAAPNNSAPSSSEAQSSEEALAAADSAAQAAAHAETISPLERLKRDPVERAGTGGRTSASDYLKKKKN